MTANMDKKSGSRRQLQLGRTLNHHGVGSAVASNPEHEASDLSALMDCIHKRIVKTTTPEFMTFKHDLIGYVLSDDFIRTAVWPNGINDFKINDDVRKEQHELVHVVLIFSSSGAGAFTM